MNYMTGYTGGAGAMPSRERNALPYKMLSFIGLMYRSFLENRIACMNALEQSERGYGMDNRQW